MDISSELWHSRVRETRRDCPTTGSATHQSGVALEKGPFLPGCGPNRSIVHKFPSTLDAILPAQRQGWLEAPPYARPTPTTATPPEAEIDRTAKTRSDSGGLSHRDVDDSSRCRANPQALGHRLSSGARLENSDSFGLELPEARAPGHPARPQKNPTVEAARVAAYKKKPGGCARIWFSSMRAGLCSFRQCCALGRRWDGRRCCGTVTAGSGFRSLEA